MLSRSDLKGGLCYIIRFFININWIMYICVECIETSREKKIVSMDKTNIAVE